MGEQTLYFILQNEPYWTIETLCRAFGLNQLTVRSWICAGTLKTIEIASRHRIYKSQWEEFLDRSNAAKTNKKGKTTMNNVQVGYWNPQGVLQPSVRTTLR